MKIIHTPRQGGKTIQTIKLASETGGYIVCFSRIEAERVFKVANELDIRIRMPITWEEFIENRGAWPNLKYHIDNIELCLERLPKQVASISITTEDEEEN